MNEKIPDFFNKFLAESAFLKSVAALKQNIKHNNQSCLFGNKTRALTRQEIVRLEKQGSRAEDWTSVKVAQEFNPANIRNSSFHGRCVLGVFDGSMKQLRQGAALPNGVYNSTIADSEIGSGCLVTDTLLISQYILKDGAAVAGCGTLTAAPDCVFGNGIPITVGRETGGREVPAFAELDMVTAGRLATRRADKELQDAYRDFIDGCLEKLRTAFGIVESGAMILNTRCIENTYIGEHAFIDGALLLRNCTVLSNLEEKTEISHGAYIADSCVQWGCTVTSMAVVTGSVLTEHSCVERQAKVTASIIGPNSVIAEGEVTSCLVGPFTGFHHQALLIAALWPGGRGNVGYGANVGSNHTSRAPDQEIFCGEGMFFGLGVNIKFPADYSGAPYSIIATGVDTSPQKVEFPFSLIRQPPVRPDGVPGYFNEIIPAWVLSDNLYMVMRNQDKYNKRDRAVRTRFDFNVFRPEIMDMVRAARDRLRAARDGGSEGAAANAAGPKRVYTEDEIPGLGRNFLQEKKRQAAVDAYTFYLEYYCLRGLGERVEELSAAGNKHEIAGIYATKTTDPRWEHARGLLKSEGHTGRTPAQNLERLIIILEKMAADALRAKRKDDTKGAAVIPDYKDSAVQAGDDEFIRSLARQTEQAAAKIRGIIAGL
jgi:carbonic anhydrase/acetyltransferase-like protein (isoleucine patch superfamily)